VNGKSSGPDLLTNEDSSDETEHFEETTEHQSLHSANFDAGGEPATDEVPAPLSPEPPADSSGLNLVDQKIGELLDEIGQGFREDDATNIEKLTIARKYGPVLWALKLLVPHGGFMDKLVERYPTVKYSKLNRWMFIAKHEVEIQEALEKYPDVAWGQKKMIDFLKGKWTPEDFEDEEEEDFHGVVHDEDIEEEPLFSSQDDMDDEAEPDPASPWAVGALNPALAAQSHAQSDGNEDDEQDQEDDEPQTPPTQNPVRPNRHLPAVNRTEFEVEVRISFKLSVPDDITAESVMEALGETENWTIGIETPFDYELSERGVRVSHVRPWE